MDPKGLDRLDYFISKLKEHGVYFGWSHSYGFHVVPGDRKRLLAYDEIAKNLNGNTYAFIHFAQDVQDFMIEMVVNLLRHKNPYTGQTYAEEPALCLIELQNEDDIFFYTSEKAFNACPTYKKRFLERFAAWLKDRYGSQEKLQSAWGDALRREEKLTDANIVPQFNPWFFGEDHLPGQKGRARRRLLDTASFLHTFKTDIIADLSKPFTTPAIRAHSTAHPGKPEHVAPLLNLYSDYKVGYIDRHNYFGGTGLKCSSRCSRGRAAAISAVGCSKYRSTVRASPSGSTLSATPMRRKGRHRGGLRHGLQGWDASYEFQSQETPALRRYRRQFSLGRLGGRRSHVAGPVPRPGPNDLPRRR